MLGAALVASATVHTRAFDPSVQEKFLEMGREVLKYDFSTVVVRSIFAGWLTALMAWLLPFAESTWVWVIVIIT